MLRACKDFSYEYDMTFNPDKSHLLVFHDSTKQSVIFDNKVLISELKCSHLSSEVISTGKGLDIGIRLVDFIVKSNLICSTIRNICFY